MMSFADFDDVYRICCEFEFLGQTDMMDRSRISRLTDDSATEWPANRWWELAEREILQEEKEVLV